MERFRRAIEPHVEAFSKLAGLTPDVPQRQEQERAPEQMSAVLMRTVPLLSDTLSSCIRDIVLPENLQWPTDEQAEQTEDQAARWKLQQFVTSAFGRVVPTDGPEVRYRTTGIGQRLEQHCRSLAHYLNTHPEIGDVDRLVDPQSTLGRPWAERVHDASRILQSYKESSIGLESVLDAHKALKDETSRLTDSVITHFLLQAVTQVLNAPDQQAIHTVNTASALDQYGEIFELLEKLPAQQGSLVGSDDLRTLIETKLLQEQALQLFPTVREFESRWKTAVRQQLDQTNTLLALHGFNG